VIYLETTSKHLLRDEVLRNCPLPFIGLYRVGPYTDVSDYNRGDEVNIF
jgi:hypothetical protein